MNGSTDSGVNDLEQAIIQRARELADEFRAKAEHRRDTLLRETQEKLHLAEEREVLAAKAEAERTRRRRTQASELRLQGRLDQLRWELVMAIQARLAERMDRLRRDPPAYRAWLENAIREAADLLPGDLLAEVNEQDHEWLESEWEALVERAAPGRVIRLNPHPTWGSGGVKLRSADNRAQVDNRFEGRLARMETELQRIILERLFPGDLNGTLQIG